MRSAVLPATLLSAALAIAAATPAFANLLVSIDKSTQRMTVTVDGTLRYVWPVSTGRPGYDTPNGTFKPNRMDADHMSQEWDNAPMPHSIFFDMNGHAIHGFFDVKHLGLPVSHGCVRLSPANAATLWDLVKAAGMSGTTVVVSGHIPAGSGQEMARRGSRVQESAAEPTLIAPGYVRAPDGYYYAQPQQRAYYGQPQTYYRQPYYGQQGYPQQPPPPQPFFPFRPFGQY